MSDEEAKKQISPKDLNVLKRNAVVDDEDLVCTPKVRKKVPEDTENTSGSFEKGKGNSEDIVLDSIKVVNKHLTIDLIDGEPLFNFDDNVLQVTNSEPTPCQISGLQEYMYAFGIDNVSQKDIQNYFDKHKGEVICDFLGYEPFNLTNLSPSKAISIRGICAKAGGKPIANFLGYDSLNPNDKDPNGDPPNNIKVPTKVVVAQCFAPDVKEYLLNINFVKSKEAEQSLNLKLPVIGLFSYSSHKVTLEQNDEFKDKSVEFNIGIKVIPVIWVHWLGHFFVTFKEVEVTPHISYHFIKNKEQTLTVLRDKFELTKHSGDIDKTITNGSKPIISSIEKAESKEAFIDLNVGNILVNSGLIPKNINLTINAKCSFKSNTKISFEHLLPAGHIYKLENSDCPYITNWHAH